MALQLEFCLNRNEDLKEVFKSIVQGDENELCTSIFVTRLIKIWELKYGSKCLEARLIRIARCQCYATKRHAVYFLYTLAQEIKDSGFEVFVETVENHLLFLVDD